MRILHVITTLDVGGAEMHVLSQVRGQAARGHRVRVAYLKGHGSLEAEFLEAGAELVRRTPLAAPWRLWPLLRWADIVHSHLLKADAFTAPFAVLAGRRRRLLSGKHNDERALLKPWVGRVHGLLGRLPVCTVVLSDHVGRFVAEHGRVPLARQRRIYYGIDPSPFEQAADPRDGARQAIRTELGAAEDDVVFTCVARFAPQKAHDVLLRAFAAARTEHGPGLRLWLVGDDPFGDGKQRAEALARELGLGADVTFLGIRRDVPQVLAASDVFVMASLWEGLGLVFLEAMATRLPVLASDVSAVPEVVEAERTGLLVPPGDPDALTSGILRLAGDPALREAFGDAGARRVRERFGLERMVEATLDLYHRVDAAAAARRRFEPGAVDP